jgi:hypothetical protein
LKSLGRRHIGLEGALFTDAFVQIRLRFHFRGHDLDRLLHRQMREGFSRRRARRRFSRRPLVRDRLRLRRISGGEFFQFA